MNAEENPLVLKSFDFALRIIKLRQYLTTAAPQQEYVMSKQLLRSGTSIGANVEEAQGAQSQADFLSKISIAYKEARESRYWIRLLETSGYITKEASESLLNDLQELCKMLGSIVKTTKTKIEVPQK